MSGVRFAPSPTGVFHVGNSRTAWISHRLARALDLPWVVRFEDIDRPRVVAGAMGRQLAEMRELGLEPDEVLVQSGFEARHRALFDRAVAAGRAYACTCSRKDVLEGLASAPHRAGALYTGHCRAGAARATSSAIAWRFRGDEDPSGAGDFAIARTAADRGEFVPAYHWACAIDDLDGGYELLVRASDLAHATPLQRRIQRWVLESEARAAELPAVFHTSLVTTADGTRLEKRTPGVTVAELLAAGLSPAELTARFARSFDDRLAHRPAPARIWGEAAAEITLAQAGF